MRQYYKITSLLEIITLILAKKQCDSECTRYHRSENGEDAAVTNPNLIGRTEKSGSLRPRGVRRGLLQYTCGRLTKEWTGDDDGRMNGNRGRMPERELATAKVQARPTALSHAAATSRASSLGRRRQRPTSFFHRLEALPTPR